MQVELKNLIEVNSLNDYLEKVHENEKDTHDMDVERYYRGEKRNFGDTKLQASVYRFLGDGDLGELIRLREKYYKEIGYSLGDRETENFIAYSQHHGLPTELLDITENSLIALYFACQHADDEAGFVYSFDSRRYVSLDKLLIREEITKQGISVRKLLEKFTKSIYHGTSIDKKEFEIIMKISKYMSSENDSHREMILKLWREIYLSFPVVSEGGKPMKLDDEKAIHLINIFESFGNGFRAYNHDIRKLFVLKDLDNADVLIEFWNELSSTELRKKISEIYPDSYDEIFGLILLLLLVDVFHKRRYPASDKACSQEGYEFPELPYFLHEPSVVFDRMANQAGKFIYQLALTDGWGQQVIQPIIPDRIFKIPANYKKQILKDLDRIGVNQKFVYPDHDNIAEYIKNNWKPIAKLLE